MDKFLPVMQLCSWLHQAFPPYLNSIGGIVPANINLTVGKPVNISCYLNLSHDALRDEYDANDVVFTINDKEVTSEYVDVPCRNQADLNIPATLDMHKSFVECLVRKKGEEPKPIGHERLHAGYLPKPIDITGIVVKNWTYLSFTWQEQLNSHYSAYPGYPQAWWKTENNSEYTTCKYATRSDNHNQYGRCTVNLLYYDITGQDVNTKITIKVNTSNVVGRTETRPISFYIFDKVKPTMVSDIMVTAVSSSEISISCAAVPWQALVYRITYIDEWDHISMTKTFETEKSSPSSRMNTTLHSLLPYTSYNISIQCRSISGGYWSDSYNTSITTLSTVPRELVQVTSGGYSIDPTTRDITIYWQHIGRRLLQGPIGNIRVCYIEENRLKTLIIEPHRTQYTIRGLSVKKPHILFVDVSTDKGFNVSAEPFIIRIPSQSIVLHWLVKLRVLAIDDHTVQLAWDEIKEATAYTIFWCQSSFNSDKCTSELRWRRLSPNERNITLKDLRKEFVLYEYGVAVDTVFGNMGIQWADCIYDSRPEPNRYAESPEIVVIKVKSKSLEVKLRIQPCGRPHGYLVNYLLEWCKVSSDRTHCLDPFSQKLVKHYEIDSIILEDLDADTKYLIKSAAVTTTRLLSFNKPKYKMVTTNPEFGGLHVAVWVIVGLVLMGISVCVILGLLKSWRLGQNCMRWFKGLKPDTNDQITETIHRSDISSSDENIPLQSQTLKHKKKRGKWKKRQRAPLVSYIGTNKVAYIDSRNGDDVYADISSINAKPDFLLSCLSKQGVDSVGRSHLDKDDNSTTIHEQQDDEQIASLNYNRAHYSIPPEVQRKIKNTKNPPQIYTKDHRIGKCSCCSKDQEFNVKEEEENEINDEMEDSMNLATKQITPQRSNSSHQISTFIDNNSVLEPISNLTTDLENDHPTIGVNLTTDGWKSLENGDVSVNCNAENHNTITDIHGQDDSSLNLSWELLPENCNIIDNRVVLNSSENVFLEEGRSKDSDRNVDAKTDVNFYNNSLNCNDNLQSDDRRGQMSHSNNSREEDEILESDSSEESEGPYLKRANEIQVIIMDDGSDGENPNNEDTVYA